MAVPGQLSRQQWTQVAVNVFTGALKSANIPVPSTAALAVMGVVFNAVGFIAFNLQQMAVYIDGIANLLTCGFNDAVTLIEPYGITPNLATAATTLVTMGVNSAPTVPVIIPFGLIFARSDNPTITYQLIADPDQGNYSPNGYILAAGATTATGPVQCLVAGSIGNTDAGTITGLPTGFGSGTASVITNVTNPSNVTNGLDVESLPSLISRFQAKNAGGQTGTPPAVYGAAMDTQAGLTVSVGDCLTQSGSTQTSWESIFVNELGNAGGPSSALLGAVAAQVDTVRAGGMEFAVYAPTILTINITAQIQLDGTVPWLTVQANAVAALTAYVNNIGMPPIQKTSLITVYKVSISQAMTAITGRDIYGNALVPGVLEIDDFLINGGTASVSIPYGYQAVIGTVSLSQE